MRKLLVVLFPLLAAGCARDVLSPDATPESPAAAAVQPGDGPGRLGRGPFAMLPDNLKLTEDQKVRIRTILQSFRAATRPASREEARAAHEKLRAELQAVLTPDQRAWLESHRPQACEAANRLTTEQRTRIRGIMQTFRNAHKPDFDAARQGSKEARERLKEAHKQLRAEIEAVLTPEQRAQHCLRGPGRGRFGGGPGHPGRAVRSS